MDWGIQIAWDAAKEDAKASPSLKAYSSLIRISDLRSPDPNVEIRWASKMTRVSVGSEQGLGRTRSQSTMKTFTILVSMGLARTGSGRRGQVDTGCIYGDSIKHLNGPLEPDYSIVATVPPFSSFRS